MSQKLHFIIVGSILLNVLLVGILFGELPHRFDRDSYYNQALEKATKKLPQAEQPAFRQMLDRMRAQADPIRNQIRAARDETLRIIVTEPFDEAAFDREVAKINGLRVEMAGILKQAGKELPLDQRRALADALKRPSSGSSS
ncbi:MAG TPA: periplasmic heavy metal sensor [Candidatus Binatia bacterium]|jgi:uncharacterized membrane protein